MVRRYKIQLEFFKNINVKGANIWILVKNLDFLHVLDITHVFLFTLVHSVSRLTPPCRQSFILYQPMTM